jgi:hypothetical protein
MLSSELIKSAIADAKAVRTTALMNAKAMLEESFSKQVREMFADKLREESEEGEEEQVDEVAAAHSVAASGGEANPGKTKDVSKGEPKKVSDASTNFKTVQAGKGPKGVPAGPSTIEETSVEEAGLSSQELEEIIGELESEISSEEGTMDGGDKPEDAAGAPAPVAPPADPAAALGAPAAPMAPPVPVQCAPAAPAAPALPGAPVDPNAPPVAPAAPMPPSPEGEEDVNLEELIKSLSEEVEEKDEDEKEEVDESVENGVPKNVAGQDAIKSPQTYPKTTSNKEIEAGKTPNTKGCIGGGEVGGLQKENTELRNELNEFRKTVEYLRGQLNEINLLNSKLLYATKLVNEHNLSKEAGKRIIDTFDLSKNVREVKLTYAALKESMNFSAQSAKKPVKTSATVQAITEGLASKAVASTKPSKEIISEGTVDQMRSRFMKLANVPAQKKV